MKKVFLSLLIICSGYTTLVAQNPVDSAQAGITADTTVAQDAIKSDTTGAMISDTARAQTQTPMSDTSMAQGAITADTTVAQDPMRTDTAVAQDAVVSDTAQVAMPSNNMNRATTDTSTDAQLRFAALPVLVTAVPESVVTSVKSKYANAYDITAIKNSSGQEVFLVRVIDNGQLKSEYVGSDGNPASK
jgi:hypothetical protein